jgi:phosphohistidine phosphatase
MLHLYLLRHAKSSWNEPALKDFDRPLAPRGWNTAPLMGEYMGKMSYQPDTILCSPAKRTRETLDMVERHLAKPHHVFMNKAIYHADSSRLLELVRSASKNTRKLMLIGHNPGIQELALTLAGDGDRKSWQNMWSKYPTAALAVLTFGAENWPQIKARAGKLIDFKSPKMLGKSA